MIRIDATNAMVIVNWKTTRPLRIKFPLALCKKLPFNATAGLKEDNTAAGYIPAINGNKNDETCDN